MYTIILETGVVTRDSDNVVVAPCQSVEEQNFIDYNAWVMAGNQPTIGMYIPPIEVPEEVTPRQIRLALTQIGMRASVEAAVAASNQEVKDTWEFSTVILRGNPLINSMGTALGKTKEDIDNLFILAATL